MRPYLVMLIFLSGALFDSSAGEKKPEPSLPKGALLRLGSAAKGSRITCVAVSPNGDMMATTSKNGKACLWDRKTGAMRNALEIAKSVDASTLWSVAFSPDGATLAVGHERGGITLWDARTGKKKQHIESDHPVYSLAFSPDGRFLASESSDAERAGFWDLRTGKSARTLERFNPVARSIAISPNGRFLASTGKHSLHLWDLQEAKLVLGRQEYAYSVTFSPGGVLMALASDHWVTLVNPATGAKLAEFRAEGSPRDYHSLAFSPDGLTLAAPHNDEIHLWDVPSRQQFDTFHMPGTRPTCLSFTSDGKTLFSGMDDGTALLWDTSSLRSKGKPQSMAELFEVLKGPDFLHGYGAFCRLRALRVDTQALLEKHLAPATKIPADGFKKLLADLDSPRFDARQRAFEELKRFGVAAENALRRARIDNARVETVRRLDELILLAEAEWPRTQWCLTLLEDAGTEPARKLIAGLAIGDGDARVTRLASAALARLNRKLP